MKINELIKIIEYKIKKNFDVTDLKIEDKSFLHSGHKNFREDNYHIKLTINSSELKKINSLESNKKVYSVLKDEMKKNIHSLQITII